MYIFIILWEWTTGYYREIGIPIYKYINARLIDELEISYYNRNQSYRTAELALDIVCQVFTRLDFAFVLKKCVKQPVQCLTHLGFMVESITEAFILPKDKIKKFSELREYFILHGI